VNYPQQSSVEFLPVIRLAKLKAFIDLGPGDRRRTAPVFRLCDGVDAKRQSSCQAATGGQSLRK